jgi:hypothetical protein
MSELTSIQKYIKNNKRHSKVFKIQKRVLLILQITSKIVFTFLYFTLLFYSCGLFNDAVSSSDCIASNDRMNNELEKIWKEGIVAKFMAIPRNLRGGTEENHKNPQSA